MRNYALTLLSLILTVSGYSQVNEINFNHQRINFSSPPRSTINPMSIKLWDNYNNGGPTSYGTVLEIYGYFSHQTSQLYFGGWDNSRIRYREAFYAQNTWSEWITLLDSKNDVESGGNLKITGSGNHYLLNGNFGIGTVNPAYKLDVAGTMRAREIIVNTTGADFVFEPTYKLPTLSELEAFIKAHKHLPGIAPAKEMQENGVSAGEMQTKLLQKVEELTLYLIEKDKELLEQRKINLEQQQLLFEMKKEIELLKKK